MNVEDPPKILVVDDQPDNQRSVFRLDECTSSTFEIAHPEEVDEEMLNSADLVLVDYEITSWPGRSKVTEIALQPKNGMALAAVFREHANNLSRPTGFAIHTAEAKQFSLTPAEPRAHLLARTHNLEWVFVKGKPEIVGPQANELAIAIRRLPAQWPSEDRTGIGREVGELLGLPNSDDDANSQVWKQAAIRDIAQCRPPLSELVERNHGLLFIRWILHRVLPYPCFLFDTHYLAARLRVTHQSLIAAMSAGFAIWLQPAEYQGVLRSFLGARWWRAGVESLLWNLNGGSLPAKKLHAKLSEITGVRFEAISAREPVVCINEDYTALPEACSSNEVVRIVPDDWPLYAGQAWTTIALANEYPRLNAIVAESDMDRLQKPKSPEPDIDE